jgi:hypothetical protein
LKAILINHYKKEGEQYVPDISVVTIPNTLKDIRQVIGCDYIDIHKHGGYDLIFDDEGRLTMQGHIDHYGYAGVLKTWRVELVGNVLVTQADMNGNTVSIEDLGNAMNFIVNTTELRRYLD